MLNPFTPVRERSISMFIEIELGERERYVNRYFGKNRNILLENTLPFSVDDDLTIVLGEGSNVRVGQDIENSFRWPAEFGA